jgi:hypothetical protein
MKKIIIFGIVAILSSNNATAMLLRHIKPTPQQPYITQKRYKVSTYPSFPLKNVFNTPTKSLSKKEVSAQIEKLRHRNSTGMVISHEIRTIMQKQHNMYCDHEYSNKELDTKELHKLEKRLQDLKENLVYTLEEKSSYLDQSQQ